MFTLYIIKITLNYIYYFNLRSQIKIESKTNYKVFKSSQMKSPNHRAVGNKWIFDLTGAIPASPVRPVYPVSPEGPPE